jgi:hypothetical protein
MHAQDDVDHAARLVQRMTLAEGIGLGSAVAHTEINACSASCFLHSMRWLFCGLSAVQIHSIEIEPTTLLSKVNRPMIYSNLQTNSTSVGKTCWDCPWLWGPADES